MTRPHLLNIDTHQVEKSLQNNKFLNTIAAINEYVRKNKGHMSQYSTFLYPLIRFWTELSKNWAQYEKRTKNVQF